jgi:hypothetical protein
MPRYTQTPSPTPSGRSRYGAGGSSRPAGAGGRYGSRPTDTPADVPFDVQPLPESDLASGVSGEDSDDFDWLLPALAGTAAVGGGLALKNPGLIKSGAGQLNNLRRAAMLAGYAPIKSALGGVGGAAVASMERGTIAPLRQVFSGQTLKDIGSNFIKGGQGAYGTHVSTGPERYYNVAGRFMGAVDEAMGAAMQRGGLTAEEAQRELLQGPGVDNFVKAVEKGGPIADYLMPFVRIPLNVAYEGIQTLNPQTAGQARTLAAMTGLGVVEGANTEGYLPLSIGAAAGGRYGLPTMLGQGIGRIMTGGDPKEASYGASPLPGELTFKNLLSPLSPFQQLMKRLGLD